MRVTTCSVCKREIHVADEAKDVVLIWLFEYCPGCAAEFGNDSGDNDMSFIATLTEREIKEIRFAKLYKESFGHGTDGHHRLCLIATLADALRDSEHEVVNLKESYAILSSTKGSE